MARARPDNAGLQAENCRFQLYLVPIDEGPALAADRLARFSRHARYHCTFPQTSRIHPHPLSESTSREYLHSLVRKDERDVAQARSPSIKT